MAYPFAFPNFFHLLLFHAHGGHHPYILTCFGGNILLLFFVSFMECKLYILKVTQRRVVQTGNHIVQIGIIANGVVPISDARRSLNKHHLWNYLAVLSNAQGNAAHLKPRTSVVVLCQCFLVFASYSELARRKWQTVAYLHWRKFSIV